ncbi:M23 family metallopeptidase [Candidatus Uhrbacteria bacterium]|nr:M23 family metallopeptidase [Candidatus Uhrbacteria bacterium]
MQSKNDYRLPLDLSRLGPKRWRKLLWLIEDWVAGAHSGTVRHAIDIMVPTGTPIVAAASGLVVWVKNDGLYGGVAKKYWLQGNRVVIRHDHDEYSAYEHFKPQGVLVHVGQRVVEGELIGYSGRTGYGFLPHLHFEIFQHPSADCSEGETIKIFFKDIGLVKDGDV